MGGLRRENWSSLQPASRLEASDELLGKPNRVPRWNPRGTQLLDRSQAATGRASFCQLCKLMVPLSISLGPYPEVGHLMSASACGLFALVSSLPLFSFLLGQLCLQTLSVLDLPGSRRARKEVGDITPDTYNYLIPVVIVPR